MALIKACDCFPDDIIVKLLAYSFDKIALAFVADYLTNRLQRVKTRSIFSSNLEILRGIPTRNNIGTIFTSLRTRLSVQFC